MKSLPSLFFVGLALALAGPGVQAQVLRDPTQAPQEMGAADGSVVPAQNSPLGNQGVAVVVRNGQSFLVVGTRLVAVGQMVGSQRLDRITETEVWLRDGKEVRKIQRFSGIQRSQSKPISDCGPQKTSKPVVCNRPQP